MMSPIGRYRCTSRLLAIRLLSRSVGSGLDPDALYAL